MTGTDTVGRSVGRSVEARVPVDHISVGLAQARPNYKMVPYSSTLCILSVDPSVYDLQLLAAVYINIGTWMNLCIIIMS